jgi:hypothetical protein
LGFLIQEVILARRYSEVKFNAFDKNRTFQWILEINDAIKNLVGDCQRLSDFLAANQPARPIRLSLSISSS